MKCLGGNFLSENELKDLGYKSLGKNVLISNRAGIYGLENISIGSNVRIDDYCVIIATGELQIKNHVNVGFPEVRKGTYITTNTIFSLWTPQ